MGLCIGASCISFLELMYFLFLQLRGCFQVRAGVSGRRGKKVLVGSAK